MADSDHYQKSDNAIVHDFYRALEPRYHAIVTHTSPELHSEQFSGFSQDQLSGLAAYLFLPKDDRERIVLFRQFATNAQAFEHTAALAMKHYLQYGADIRMSYGLDWRNCLKDSERSVEIPVQTVTLLDVLATYLQMPQGNDHERFNMLLHSALQLKLITAEEFSRIHDDVFDYLKPPPRVDLELFKKTIERMKAATIDHIQIPAVISEEKIEHKEPPVVQKIEEKPEEPPQKPIVALETTVPERKINFWYERLIELSEGGSVTKEEPKKEQMPIKEEVHAEKPKDTVEEKVEPKKEKEAKVSKIKPVPKRAEKKEVEQKSEAPPEKKTTDEQKRRDLLGKLQSLGSFK